jgi:hypothetical protein
VSDARPATPAARALLLSLRISGVTRLSNSTPHPAPCRHREGGLGCAALTLAVCAARRLHPCPGFSP